VRLTITIIGGTRHGQRILLAPGESLRVGRTTKADIAITDDPTMSGVHFLIAYSGESTTVRDLESRNGLFVNGKQVIEATVQSGDQIRAGRTSFGLSLETVDGQELEAQPVAQAGDETRGHRASDATRGVLPPLPWGTGSAPPQVGTMYVGDDGPPLGNDGPLAQHEAIADPAAADVLVDQTGGNAASATDEASDDPPTLEASVLDAALSVRQSTELQPRLYAVVDGSVAQSLVQTARRENLNTESLLANNSSPYLAAVAPYLIEVRLDSSFLAAWHAMLNKNPGVLIESPADFAQVLIHLRSLFSRKDERGKQSFFRFYDPNLLYGWLSTCTSPQVSSFFGCLTAIIVGVDSGNRILRLTPGGDALNADEIFAT
jgi:hypothetical protein